MTSHCEAAVFLFLLYQFINYTGQTVCIQTGIVYVSFVFNCFIYVYCVSFLDAIEVKKQFNSISLLSEMQSIHISVSKNDSGIETEC